MLDDMIVFDIASRRRITTLKKLYFRMGIISTVKIILSYGRLDIIWLSIYNTVPSLECDLFFMFVNFHTF